MTETKRFTVRVGDDGRVISSHDSLGEAREAARALSTQRLMKAQIRDTNDGWSERWSDGERTTTREVLL